MCSVATVNCDSGGDHLGVVSCPECLELSFRFDRTRELAMAEARPRILIADDHRLVAEAVKNLLILEFSVLGVVGDGRALVQATLEMKPDVVLVDIAMPQLNGFDAGRRIKGALPDTKIIYLTGNHDPDVMAEAFAIGASGFVLKTFAFSALIQTIRAALSDPKQVTPRATGPAMDTKIGQSHKAHAESARCSSVACERTLHEGNRRRLEPGDDNGGFSKIPHHGKAGSA